MTGVDGGDNNNVELYIMGDEGSIWGEGIEVQLLEFGVYPGIFMGYILAIC